MLNCVLSLFFAHVPFPPHSDSLPSLSAASCAARGATPNPEHALQPPPGHRAALWSSSSSAPSPCSQHCSFHLSDHSPAPIPISRESLSRRNFSPAGFSPSSTITTTTTSLPLHNATPPPPLPRTHLHPRLLTTLVLYEPVIQADSPPGSNAARPSTLRLDLWPSLDAAATAVRKNKFFQSWDPCMRDTHIAYAFRATLTRVYPPADDDGSTSSTSTSSFEMREC